MVVARPPPLFCPRFSRAGRVAPIPRTCPRTTPCQTPPSRARAAGAASGGVGVGGHSRTPQAARAAAVRGLRSPPRRLTLKDTIWRSVVVVVAMPRAALRGRGSWPQMRPRPAGGPRPALIPARPTLPNRGGGSVSSGVWVRRVSVRGPSTHRCPAPAPPPASPAVVPLALFLSSFALLSLDGFVMGSGMGLFSVAPGGLQHPDCGHCRLQL